MRIVNPTGVLGENAACLYLQKKGYQILERNFRKSYGEVDIIALDSSTLVFVEVKTRSNSSYGTPFDAISSSKLVQIKKTGEFYKFILHSELPEDMRIDAVGVIVEGKRIKSIEHIKNVGAF